MTPSVAPSQQVVTAAVLPTTPAQQPTAQALPTVVAPAPVTLPTTMAPAPATPLPVTVAPVPAPQTSTPPPVAPAPAPAFFNPVLTIPTPVPAPAPMVRPLLAAGGHTNAFEKGIALSYRKNTLKVLKGFSASLSRQVEHLQHLAVQKLHDAHAMLCMQMMAPAPAPVSPPLCGVQ